MTSPDVSIILITYNDAGRLPRAIASIQRQTLHNIEIIVVDDASTDHTADVLAEIHDPRIRSIRLERNSGGCSAPRNAGLAIATGTWVMFCDSDDELEMHAAKNLLIAVEEADADLGCGVAERVDVRSGKTRRWRAEHHVPGVIEDLRERPGLMFDTICVNKIYRRSWLADLRFVDGLLYEDQLFTLQCYLRADRIAIIDQTVYYWYVEKLSESITQRRDEHRNIENRIAINRLMDAELLPRADLKRIKDHKFLAHEVYLYLRTIERMDDHAAQELLAPLVSYTAKLDLAAADDLRPALRVAVYHLLRGDLPGVRRAMRNIAWSAVIDMPIVSRDGHDYWGCPDLVDGTEVGGMPATRWLDISTLRASAAPFPQQRPCHVVTEITPTSIAGSTVDAYGNADRIRDLALVWIAPGEQVLARSALIWSLESGVLQWRGPLRVPHVRGRSAYLALEMLIGDSVNRTAVRWEGILPESMSEGEFGTIRWRDVRDRFSRAQRIARRIAGRLPGRSALVFDHDDWGRSASLSALVAQRAPEIPQYWVERPGAPPGPSTAEIVEQGSPKQRLLRPRAVEIPWSVVAAHAAAVDQAQWRRTLDIAGPIVVYLPAAEPAIDWLEQVESVGDVILVQRLDGQPVHVPAAMRAWVRDARGLPRAALLALADRCVVDDQGMAAFVRSLGIPVVPRLDASAEPRRSMEPAVVEEGLRAVDEFIGELRT